MSLDPGGEPEGGTVFVNGEVELKLVNEVLAETPPTEIVLDEVFGLLFGLLFGLFGLEPNLLLFGLFLNNDS